MHAPRLGVLRFGTVLLLLSALACTTTSDDEPTGSAGNGATDAGSGAGGKAGKGASGNGAAGDRGSSAGRSGAGAGKGAVDGGSAGSGGDTALQDAGPDEDDAAVSCEGEIVADSSRCLQDDAFCYPLGDGRYCTGPQAPECPRNSKPIAKDAPCPARTQCWDYSESLRCATRLYTLEECAAAGGVGLSDPGDGSLVCPNDAEALGSIEGAGWDEGGLCCPAPKHCGARAGDTCQADEYCAYRAGQLCGAADAEASCEKRPTSCSGPSAPVCGCDRQTYPSACEAALAGVGLFADEACE
jgi:hypothetical protein